MYCWLILRNLRHSSLLAITHSSAANVLQAWHDGALLALTWLHHVGMGPSMGGKQRPDTNTCLYFCLLTLQEKTSLAEKHGCVCLSERAFSRTLSLSGFPWSSVITSSLQPASLCLSLFFSLSASWGQDQAWVLETGSSKLAYLAHNQEKKRGPVRCSLLRHKRSLCTAVLFIWWPGCLPVSPRSASALFSLWQGIDKWTTRFGKGSLSLEASFHRGNIRETHKRLMCFAFGNSQTGKSTNIFGFGEKILFYKLLD